MAEVGERLVLGEEVVENGKDDLHGGSESGKMLGGV